MFKSAFRYLCQPRYKTTCRVIIITAILSLTLLGHQEMPLDTTSKKMDPITEPLDNLTSLDPITEPLDNLTSFTSISQTYLGRYRKCIALFHKKSNEAFFVDNSQPKDLNGMAAHLLSYLQHQKYIDKKSGCRPPRYVHRCHEPLCGGLGDRIRGMILSFYTSLFWGFSLEFRMDYPSQISDFFVTANSELLNLETKSDLNGVSDIKIFYYIDLYDDSFYEQTDFGSLWNFPIVEIRTNVMKWSILKKNHNIPLSSEFPYIQRLDYLEMAHLAIQLLLRPSPYLADEMKKYTSKIAGYDKMFKIGIQLRTGDASMIKNYAGQAPIRHSSDCGYLFAQEAIKVAIRNPSKQYLFFITSDSENAALIIKKKISGSLPQESFFILETQGQAFHIDKVPLHTKVEPRKYIKTYLDWAFLSKMDALVISRSGFGETAAWASMAETLVFVEDKANLTNSYFVDYLERARKQ